MIGFSTRVGGVSVSPFHSLNMSVSRGDDPTAVETNRQLFLEALGIQENELAKPVQISTDHVQIISNPGSFAETDALITGSQGIYLSILTADCVPALFWSESAGMVGAVHSGWQGSEKDILGKTLDMAKQDLGVSMDSVHLVLGPALSEQNFEVGPEFADKFHEKYLRPAEKSGKFYFDNNRQMCDSAVAQGVPKDQIEVLPGCTFADSELFFSHRRDKGSTGRMMSVIGFKA